MAITCFSRLHFPHLIPLQRRASSQMLVLSKQVLLAGAKGNLLLHCWLLAH